MTQRLYYMHPINTYGTVLEREQLSLLRLLFPDWEVVNPNEPRHQQACDEMKAKTGNGMPYFVALAASCQGGVLLPFRDGQIGAGIWKEAVTLADRGFPIWELTHTNNLVKFLPSDPTRKLTVEETRARIRHPDGSRKDF